MNWRNGNETSHFWRKRRIFFKNGLELLHAEVLLSFASHDKKSRHALRPPTASIWCVYHRYPESRLQNSPYFFPKLRRKELKFTREKKCFDGFPVVERIRIMLESLIPQDADCAHAVYHRKPIKERRAHTNTFLFTESSLRIKKCLSCLWRGAPNDANWI